MIPIVKYGGLKFLEAAHVKDVLSILKWADNPRKRLAGFRAARLIPGVGAATARKLLDLFDKAVESTVSDGGISRCLSRLQRIRKHLFPTLAPFEQRNQSGRLNSSSSSGGTSHTSSAF